MAIRHAAAILVDQFLYRNASRCQLDTGLFYPATDAKAAQPLAAITAKTAEPLRSLFKDVTHPVKGFKVVLQRGPAKQPHLGNIRGTHAWLTAFAFNAFDHGRLFATNVGTRTAP